MVHCLAASPDGALAAVGGSDEAIHLFAVVDANTITPRGRLSGHRDWIHALAWSPDGVYLCSAGWDSAAILWDVRNGSAAHTLTHAAAVEVAAFAPNGKLLTGCNAAGSAPCVWSAGPSFEAARELVCADAVGSGCNAAVWLRDCVHCVVAHTDCVVRGWDTRSGSCLIRFVAPSAVRTMVLGASDADGAWPPLTRSCAPCPAPLPPQSLLCDCEDTALNPLLNAGPELALGDMAGAVRFFRITDGDGSAWGALPEYYAPRHAWRDGAHEEAPSAPAYLARAGRAVACAGTESSWGAHRAVRSAVVAEEYLGAHEAAEEEELPPEAAMLLDMGFDRATVAAALRTAGGDVNGALMALLG